VVGVALAVLVVGTLILGIAVPVVDWGSERANHRARSLRRTILLFFLIGLAWFIVEVALHGFATI
jgi:hypothetical protein